MRLSVTVDGGSGGGAVRVRFLEGSGATKGVGSLEEAGYFAGAL